MKLKLLSIAFFFISSTILCQTVTIPDQEFKQALLNYSPSIDTNNDNEIQLTEAAVVTELIISGYQGFEVMGFYQGGLSDFTGIEAFVNLTSLNCSYNDLTSLDVSALTQLTSLDCSSNINYNDFNGIAIGISTLILPSSGSLTTLNTTYNNLSTLDLSNQTGLTSVITNNNVITNLNLTNTPMLESLKCDTNQLTSLNISSSVALTNLECFQNQITSLDATNNTSLITLKSYNNNLSTLTLPSSNSLTHLFSWSNSITSLDASMATGLIEISIYSNSLTSLTLPTTTTLTKLSCNQNNLTTLDTSVATGLVTLNTSNNALTSLTLPSSSSLKTLACSVNQLPTLDTSVSTGLTSINTASNLLTSLTLPSTATLVTLICSNNQLTALNTSIVTGLSALICSDNAINSLDVSLNTNLTNLSCNNNNLTAINTLSNTSLSTLGCNGNQITSLDASTITTVNNLYCSNNLITDLDLSSFTNLNALHCDSNPNLSSLNLKNGNTSSISSNNLKANNNPNLLSICVDDATVAAGMYANIDTQTNFTEYCSFVPVSSNTITGTISYDFNNDGCDAADTKSVNTRINSVSTNVSASSFSAADGTYTVYINDTNVDTEIIPNFPSYFSVTPTTQTTNFTGSGNTEVIDFCITANTQINDVEIYSFTTSESRPGFDTQLRIFYKNNGSTIIPSGTVTLNFNENQEVFNNASTNPDTQTSNSLSWDYTNLLPFEEKYIDVYFTINTPVDPTNPVNGGDTISYTTSITPLTADATPTDNNHIFSDIIVNAYDPNDVVCFEGDRINTLQVPNDLTYRVRFQNTGTASAINIVVKETLDADLDMATFQPISASHNYRIAINNTNDVEFIFENIHLADSTSNEPASHGWLFYKIKPKSTAVIGDAFDATANIYFDYNAPVITNTYNTTVSTTTNIPDANFEQALIDLGYDSGAIDGLVFTSDINTITTLNVSNKNIADLTGIEDFIALEDLRCNNNLLTTLDVSLNTSLIKLHNYSNQLTTINITSNTALQQLLCNSNQLTSIDVSQNTALTHFYSYNNPLGSLDVTQNTALAYFQCNNNQLTELDLSQNSVLFRLYCQDNLLTSLNIKNGNNSNMASQFYNSSNNPNLTCIEVDDATYSTTNWTNKDTASSFSENCATFDLTNVPDDNFEHYLESHDSSGNVVTVGSVNSMGNGIDYDDYVTTSKINAVTYLNIHTRNIVDLTGIEDFTALSVFYCFNNQISTLDLSSNLSMKDIFCYNNSITTINVSQNANLEFIAAANNQLTTIDISQNPLLDHLDVSRNQIVNLNTSQNPNLIRIRCFANHITSLDVTQNVGLIEFSCYGNQLTTLDVSQNIGLLDFVCSDNQLTTLDLSQNIALLALRCQDNQLTSLNAANGNNSSITNSVYFNTSNNPNLTCIEVDDAAYATTNWTNVDTTSTFVNNQTECAALSTDNYNLLEFSLYPNPTKGNIHITVLEKADLIIYSLIGKELKQLRLNSGNNEITHLNLAKGIYLFKLVSKEKSSTKKVIVN